jgi:hypothetical protein
VTLRDDYLASVAELVRGSGSDRLLVELRDHIDDAAEEGIADAVAIARLGAAEDVSNAWRSYIRARRARTRQHWPSRSMPPVTDRCARRAPRQRPSRRR